MVPRISRWLWILPAAALSAFAAQPYGQGRQVTYGETDAAVDKRLDLMTKKLQLQPDQIYRVKQALEDQGAKLDQLKKEVAEAKKRIADDTDGALLGILNPEQQEKYKQIRTDVLGKAE